MSRSIAESNTRSIGLISFAGKIKEFRRYLEASKEYLLKEEEAMKDEEGSHRP